MLTIENLEFAYGGVKALNGISMQFKPGTITGVMGRNGVGKTTLVKNIMGVLRCDRGSITLADSEISRVPGHKRVKAGLGLVPQGREIFPKLTVLENIKVGCQSRPDGKRTPPDEILDLFEILRPMSARAGGDLSGGQQQQLAIARALAGDPTVLVLDEPTEGIQPNIIQEIGRVLQRLAKEQNMTVILVEQYLDFVHEICDQFYLMDRGKVVAEGPIDELTEDLSGHYLSV
jgi:urea transport system ATP-binding protein